jgi:hypothetical protein
MGDYFGEIGPDTYLEEYTVEIRTPIKNVGIYYRWYQENSLSTTPIVLLSVVCCLIYIIFRFTLWADIFLLRSAHADSGVHPTYCSVCIGSPLFYQKSNKSLNLTAHLQRRSELKAKRAKSYIIFLVMCLRGLAANKDTRKVNFTLSQATKAQKWSRGITLLFL